MKKTKIFRNKFDQRDTILIHCKPENIAKRNKKEKQKNTPYLGIGRFNVVQMVIFPKAIYRFSTIPIKI